MKASSILLTLVTIVAMATGRTLVRQKRQNYDALLQNKAFVESQLNCVLSRGHCDRIGHRIKIIVPEVVRTKECKSCTDDERVNVQKVADHVKIHYPKEWLEIKDEFTPEEEEEEHDGSSEDMAAEEEETMEPQKQAKALNDNSQEDNQDKNNNDDDDNNNNNNNSSNDDNNNNNNSSNNDDNNQNNNNTSNNNNNNNNSNNNNFTTTANSNSQENDEFKHDSQENGKQNGAPQQRTERKEDGVETSTPK